MLSTSGQARPASTNPGAQLGALTGLRFFAAMYVVLFHSGAAAARAAGLPKPVLTLLDNGYLGVTFFFVLSGFILRYTYRRSDWTGASLRSFGIARFARIYPIYILALVAMIPFPTGEGLVWPQILLLQSWFPVSWGAANWNMPAWTLSVELLFYLLFPALALAAARLPPRALAAIGLATGLFILVANSSSLAASEQARVLLLQRVPIPLLRLPEFILGVILGEAHLRGLRLPGPRRCEWLLAAIITILALIESPWAAGIFTLLSAWLIAVVARSESGLAMGFFASRLVVFAGGASYALYLLQQPVHFASVALLGESVGRIAQIPLLLLASAAAFHFIEEPARRAIRRRLDSGHRRKALTA